MSSAGQKRSPPGELEREVNTPVNARVNTSVAASITHQPYACTCLLLLMVSCHLQHTPFQGEEAKRQKPSQSPNVVSFRLLCPGARTGSIIGKVLSKLALPLSDHISLRTHKDFLTIRAVVKGGEIIRELREQTGTRIKIEDPVANCEDRVVTIVGPDRCSTDFARKAGSK